MYPRSLPAPSFSAKNSEKALLYFSFASGFRLSKLVFMRTVTVSNPSCTIQNETCTYDGKPKSRRQRATESESLVVRVAACDVSLGFSKSSGGELVVSEKTSGPGCGRSIL